ncbi:MAG: MarR family transcriptional regulator [Brevibacterium sp.]|uniref:MarR family winged helix-turn-helix transcriptional regulator n=1 Tax=Brevibacterium sandarakinum TaxID=629680 RepID=UPI00264EE139|nr:MarR family transcriptional regulator [Brevibacterium sandarakinum]MDN5585473.1 MarR family transcriptional regulator [Brevibacterium sp.]MDN5634954.1 MarR family transcriptional regulator [Brevibacterium sp.]MDN5657323.1 MarR family transcriptional regulator [Brevibacterium sandarakinum]
MVEIKLGIGRDALAQRSWRVYFETSQRIRQNLEGNLKNRAGLTVSDYNTLLLLWEEPTHTLTMSVLARKLVFSPSRLNYRIKVLEDAGLVTKTECADDKRAHNVGLTEAGAQAFLNAGRQHRENIDEVFLSHVDDDELEVIEAVFARIGKALPE